MKSERFKELKQHIQYAEDGSPIKDFENIDNLIWELWDEIGHLRKALLVHRHTNECFQYAAKTAAQHGNAHCIAKCADSWREVMGEAK